MAGGLGHKLTARVWGRVPDTPLECTPAKWLRPLSAQQAPGARDYQS